MIDIEKLKAAALAATPGPWESDTTDNDGEYGSGEDCYSGFKSYVIVSKDGRSICDTLNSDLADVHEEADEDGHYAWDDAGRRNAEFIAAANPATVLDLIAQLDAAKKDAERVPTRGELLHKLYHHQGGNSVVGQCIREIFGIGQFDRLSKAHLAEIKAYTAAIQGEKYDA